MISIALKLLMAVVSILLIGPLVGGLLSGTDRFLSARMQRRQGPPILQPFYDISKFFQKKAYIVNGLQHFLVVGHLLFLMLSIGIIYAGQDILLAIFSLTLAEMMLCLAAFSASAPYSNMSAQREMLQMACAEPILLLLCIGLYLSSGSFMVKDIIRCDLPAVVKTPGIFFAFLIALPIELRKSPFDIGYLGERPRLCGALGVVRAVSDGDADGAVFHGFQPDFYRVCHRCGIDHDVRHDALRQRVPACPLGADARLYLGNDPGCGWRKHADSDAD